MREKEKLLVVSFIETNDEQKKNNERIGNNSKQRITNGDQAHISRNLYQQTTNSHRFDVRTKKDSKNSNVIYNFYIEHNWTCSPCEWVSIKAINKRMHNKNHHIVDSQRRVCASEFFSLYFFVAHSVSRSLPLSFCPLDISFFFFLSLRSHRLETGISFRCE